MYRVILMMLLVLVSSSALTGQAIAEDEVYLQCKGDIYILRVNDVPQTMEKQEIAAHITNGKINFSGNGLLLGESIQICTPSADQPYFDSDSCNGTVKNEDKRKYGTYNKITGALDLSNTFTGGSTYDIHGHFKCTKVKPLMK